MLVKKGRSLLLLYLYLICPGILSYQESKSFRIPVASFMGAGSVVKGQYAGCTASGQPLTEQRGKPFSAGTAVHILPLPCLPARGKHKIPYRHIRPQVPAAPIVRFCITDCTSYIAGYDIQNPKRLSSLPPFFPKKAAWT